MTVLLNYYDGPKNSLDSEPAADSQLAERLERNL
jgi:hypothetical protein